jgi:hypothetical protein
MPTANDPDRVVIHYFVDEAGTPTLFRRRRQSIVGVDGCSKYFILGSLEIDDPIALRGQLNELRKELLTDPYFKDVPSMQRSDKKTSLMFHAKDDLPEIRYRVFKLLAQQSVSFHAVVRDKQAVLAEVLARNEADTRYWYRENDLYDELVAHLFKSRFHRGDHFEIYFARRGKTDRTESLELALDQARRTYESDMGVPSRASIAIHASTPMERAGLQAVDYFLWALQRLYEKDEDRYWETVRHRAKVIYDMDDKRSATYGVYYTAAKPLTLAVRAKK